MPTVRRHITHSEQHYNPFTDVLDVSLRAADETITEDTPSGFIVHYAISSNEPVGVTVWHYCRRFGDASRTLHIDAAEPFTVDVQGVDACSADDFDEALRQALDSGSIGQQRGKTRKAGSQEGDEG